MRIAQGKLFGYKNILFGCFFLFLEKAIDKKKFFFYNKESEKNYMYIMKGLRESDDYVKRHRSF